MADDVQPDEVTAELDKMGAAPAAPAQDSAPKAKGRRSRSGTSGAERARRAKATPGATPAPARPRTRATRPKIGPGMANLYTMAGGALAVVPFGPPAVAGPHAGAPIVRPIGAAVIECAEPIGAAWQKAADDDARIREALEKLLTVSTVGALVAAHMPIVLAAAIAAGAIPQEVLLMLAVANGAGEQPEPDGNNKGGRP